jgi:excisionase family DNA binding protein
MQTNKEPKHFKAMFSVAEFCHGFSIGRTSFYDAVAQNKIKTVKFGRRTMVPASEVDAFMSQFKGEI